MTEALRSPKVLRVIIKISQVDGSEAARRVVDECLLETGLGDIRTADDTLRLADALIRRGGFPAVVGRSVKIDALLGGAGRR